MGCFPACFGGDRRRRHRKSRTRSPARTPTRPAHVVLVGKAAESVLVKEEAALPPPLHEAKALSPASPPPPPPPVDVAEEVPAGGSPTTELRDLIAQNELPARSLLPEKQATPPHSPAACSPVVASADSTADRVLREVSEQESHGSGKKVTFNMNVTMYESTALPDQEEEPPEPAEKVEDEDGKHMQKTVLLPVNHRYRNCSNSDDDEDEDEDGEDDIYGDDTDEEEDDFLDCTIDLVDEEEMSSEENQQESHESLFSLPMSADKQNGQEVSSPAPKSSVVPVDERSPIIQGNNPRDRSRYVRPVLNPVQDLSQWREVKAQSVPVKKLDKENEGASPRPKVENHIKMSPGKSIKREVSVDASLSTWLVSSDNSTVDKAQSKSPHSISSVSRDERPVLGALTVDDLKQASVTSSPRRSPSHNHYEVPILGTVGSYWSCTKQENTHSSPKSDPDTHGIPNTTSKYREDKRVNWHSTPFNVRLDRALKKSPA